MRKILLGGFALIFGLYTTFVLQNLWNWFIASAINAAPISYWHMFGLNLVLQMLIKRGTFDVDRRWKRADLLLLACVPVENRSAVEDALNDRDKEESLLKEAWADAFLEMSGNTLALVVGWVVHGFLA